MTSYVRSLNNDPTDSLFHQRQGRVLCPIPLEGSPSFEKCRAVFSNADVCKHVLDSQEVDRYIEGLQYYQKVILVSDYFEQLQQNLNEIQKEQNDAHGKGESTEVDSSVDRRRKLMELEQLAECIRIHCPDARQCNKCGFGPILMDSHCDRLTDHHKQKVRNGGAYDNSCRGCGVLTESKSQLPRWDGKLPDSITMGSVVKATGKETFDRFAELVKDLKLTADDFESQSFRSELRRALSSTQSYEPEMVTRLRGILTTERQRNSSDRKFFRQHPHALQRSSVLLQRTSACNLCGKAQSSAFNCEMCNFHICRECTTASSLTNLNSLNNLRQNNPSDPNTSTYRLLYPSSNNVGSNHRWSPRPQIPSPFLSAIHNHPILSLHHSMSHRRPSPCTICSSAHADFFCQSCEFQVCNGCVNHPAPHLRNAYGAANPIGANTSRAANATNEDQEALNAALQESSLLYSRRLEEELQATLQLSASMQSQQRQPAAQADDPFASDILRALELSALPDLEGGLGAFKDTGVSEEDAMLQQILEASLMSSAKPPQPPTGDEDEDLLKAIEESLRT
eukprot:CAMPEP_0170088542 /NCGR_PEP_ID=MMETSP0019_2-20121128/22793_1 /TAXON_ID=98059 /ORGANISM="Dinobryon sp., Strain UTEXLB2267" /LENGTH=565 /DNA_ID=CAMNT_0010306843 /DNA_START=559 /DNA_END=2256 /DNA_ORIENTATION=+